MFGQSRELASTTRDERRKRQAIEELVRHALGESGRLELEEARADGHRRVDANAAGVVRYQHGSRVSGYALDVMTANAEVLLVQWPEPAESQIERMFGGAVRIVAARFEGQLEPFEALFDVVVTETKHAEQDTRARERIAIASSTNTWPRRRSCQDRSRNSSPQEPAPAVAARRRSRSCR